LDDYVNAMLDDHNNNNSTSTGPPQHASNGNNQENLNNGEHQETNNNGEGSQEPQLTTKERRALWMTPRHLQVYEDYQKRRQMGNMTYNKASLQEQANAEAPMVGPDGNDVDCGTSSVHQPMTQYQSPETPAIVTLSREELAMEQKLFDTEYALQHRQRTLMQMQLGKLGMELKVASIDVDFCDLVQFESGKEGYDVGVSVKIHLDMVQHGNSHENVGYGLAQHQFRKVALLVAKHAAIRDAVDRGVKMFQASL